jgi:MFS-type transporter involved in bile tolerance (Atg22 family)
MGLALFIAAIAMIVFGMTTAARYGSLPPPNAGGIGQGQVIGGAALAVLGLAVLGSALAVLADVRGSRQVVIAISALTAVLSAIGVLRVMTLGFGDPVLAGALAIVTILFAAAAVVLARPRR